MTSILVKHTVEDYDAWKPVYDDHASTREEYGEQDSRLFRVSDDPNEIVALYEWDTKENAEEFFEASDLREVMESSGVVGKPEFYFLDEVEAETVEEPVA